MLTKSLERDAAATAGSSNNNQEQTTVDKPSGSHPGSPPGIKLEMRALDGGVVVPSTLPPLRGSQPLQQQRGLGGALLALREQQKTETPSMTMLKDIIGASLISMEQRIESRIEGIEQTLFNDAHPELEEEDYEQDLGNDETGVDTPEQEVLLQRIATMEAALLRYKSYLNPRDPMIVSLLQQLASTCGEAQQWRQADQWRKKAEKASRAEEDDGGEEEGQERGGSFFADGPVMQNLNASLSASR
jgi:hypothetical protein